MAFDLQRFVRCATVRTFRQAYDAALLDWEQREWRFNVPPRMNRRR